MTDPICIQPVSQVERATRPLAETPSKELIETTFQLKVEACSDEHSKMIATDYHPFVAAIHAAFNDHRPLVLSPDMFWLLICQGLSRHVNVNSEEMRSRFVEFKGKKTLAVHRDDFIKGSPHNPWSDVFEEFSAQIRTHIGEEGHTNIVANFSTTGPVEKAANEIVLMSTVKTYFDFLAVTACGIPEVQLEGTAADWRELYDRTKALGKRYDLNWWTTRLLPMLERVALNAAGADDPELWVNLYKFEGGSGGPYIDGWILDCFPYLSEAADVPMKASERSSNILVRVNNETEFELVDIDTRNRTFTDKGEHRITNRNLPGGLSTAPLKWKYLTDEYDMQFVAGFVGFTQRKRDLAVRPKIGWAVCDA
ncbi:MAG: DUF4419 domain-containing protein [Gammaproteobacteria bacterium]